MTYMRRRQDLASCAAASTSGPNQAWLPGNKSADEIIKTDHKLMRGRARSLIRDSIIAHIFIRDRISQNRGVSWLGVIVMEMRDFYEYQSGERIAKCLAPAMGLFVTTP